MPDRDAEFGEYLSSRAVVMRRTASLQCGGDWHRAEGLVQPTLTKMARAAIDDSRRACRRREAVVDALPDLEATPPAGVEDAVDVRRRWPWTVTRCSGRAGAACSPPVGRSPVWWRSWPARSW